MERPTKKQYQRAAKRLHHNEGAVEVDDNPIVSNSDNGAYVQVWVWVHDDEAEKENPK